MALLQRQNMRAGCRLPSTAPRRHRFVSVVIPLPLLLFVGRAQKAHCQ